MKDFRGKVVVVTGAAMGIGKSLAEKAVQEGCRGLVVADIGAEQLEETAAALRRLGSTIVVTAVIDASKLADVQRLLTTTLDHFGEVNLACFNAGVGGGRGSQSVIDGDMEQWAWVQRVNFWGPLYGSKLFGKHMVQQAKSAGTEGHIVNTASMAGVVAGFLGAYSTSKVSCVALTERLAQDFFDAGVYPTVSASVLCPAFVATNIYDQSKYAESGSSKPRQGAAQVFGKLPGSIAPGAVADAVFDGVRRGLLYINTHPDELAVAVTRRAQRLIAAEVPVREMETRRQLVRMQQKLSKL